ncbi:E3 ubiquitin-protein ligase TRIM35 [Hypomesus transpacificus]|uniref:E3 ubiquitin-protein ligase TRIM35 n=1 Tax=Hypomesus transpacificus TaxID=137520 RepID=UPI001F07A629|nr:E3 ubiquitin-protein ligase TRIM35 [Hypomesus transpacificus]XP_046878701.1 E3 ubiquitin-protein ligase TRIM35 [Hypomesus transpacificus]
MAVARLSLAEVDLSCPICCDIFRDPVVLKCSHSFCASCLQQYWSGKGSCRDCPLCRRETAEEPVASLTLKNLCESYIQESEAQDSAGELYCEPGELCALHGERLKLFCLQDKVPICVVCHTSRKHKQHECCPVNEAIVEMKEKITFALTSLQEKKESFDKTKQSYENITTHLQAQAYFVERRTHEEFEMLHQFLKAEEEARMASLKEEQESKTERMRQKIEEVNHNIAALSDTIRSLEAEMALEDISLLHKYKKTMSSAQCTLQEPVVDQGCLIDVAKYLGSLKYMVWERMRGIIKYTPVTLDPNTAAPWLLLSEDLTSVRDSDDKQMLPENPERFDPDTGVLGHEGFTSGKHTWDVEVGENTAWVLGVAKESVLRKEKVSSVLKNGYLSVYFYHKMYFAGTSPLTRLNLKKKPHRIRVQVDCERGRVSFSDPADNSNIYTFKHIFSEKVFPYFWVGCKQCPLRIEPLEVSVKTIDCS